MYEMGVSAHQLASFLNVWPTAVWKHLNKAGVKARPHSIANRRYALNDLAFDEITPEAEYWIGFLLADGCVSDSNILQVGLATADVAHLEKLTAFLGSDKSPSIINCSNGTTFASLSVNSHRICARLRDFGVVPRKTATARAPQALINSRDFWRGCVDGDGFVSATTPSRAAPRLGFCGTPEIVEQFRQFVCSVDAKYTAKAQTQNAIQHLHTKGWTAVRLAQTLYAEAPVSLDRKAAAAKEVLNWARSPERRKTSRSFIL